MEYGIKNRVGYGRQWMCRVLINSRFGVLYSSNFWILNPTFCKVSIKLYRKTPTFSGRWLFYSNFQNPNENAGVVGWSRLG